MEILKTKNGTSVQLQLIGRLDTSTSPQLEEAIGEVIDNATEICLDLSKLDYLSSAGLRVLLSTHKQMLKKGSFTICNVNETVMDVLEMTGFVDFLDIK